MGNLAENEIIEQVPFTVNLKSGLTAWVVFLTMLSWGLEHLCAR